MSENVYIAKRGNSCTIFVDPVTSTPMFLKSPDDQPVGGLPVSCNIKDWQKALGRAGVRGSYLPVFLETKRPEPASVIRTDAVIQATNKILEKEGQKVDERSADIPNSPIDHPPIELPKVAKSDKMLSEFKMLLGKYSVATGKTKTTLKIELNAVANFILAVAPEQELELNLLKENLRTPRFDIDV